MTYQSPLLVVKDINKSREFYCKLFGLEVIMDFGAKHNPDRRHYRFRPWIPGQSLSIGKKRTLLSGETMQSFILKKKHLTILSKA